MSSLRQAQKELTRRRLLAAAAAAFAAKGFESTTIDDITRAAGATRATFYLHFDAKVDAALALFERLDAVLGQDDGAALEDVVASGERSAIAEWLDVKFDEWGEVRDELLAVYTVAPGAPAVHDALEAWLEHTVGRMQAGLDAADRFEADTRRARCLLAFGQLEYIAQRWLRHGWRIERRVVHAMMTDSWMALLGHPRVSP